VNVRSRNVNHLLFTNQECVTSRKANIVPFMFDVQLQVHLLDHGFHHQVALRGELNMGGRFALDDLPVLQYCNVLCILIHKLVHYLFDGCIKRTKHKTVNS